jgi:hypothetical protein
MVWRGLKYPVAFALAGIGLSFAACVIGYLVTGVAIGAANTNSVAGYSIDVAATFLLSVWSVGLAMRLVCWQRSLRSTPIGLPWRIFRLLAVAAGIASLCVVVLPLSGNALVAALLWSGTNPGPFDRPRMERIVAQVRQLDLKGSGEFYLNLSGKISPGTDKMALSRSLWEAITRKDYWIEAERDDDGTLSVVIITRNLNHAGAYGFAYSDKILKPQPDEFSYGGLSLDVPSGVHETDQNGKIDDHWWKVANTQ